MLYFMVQMDPIPFSHLVMHCPVENTEFTDLRSSSKCCYPTSGSHTCWYHYHSQQKSHYVLGSCWSHGDWLKLSKILIFIGKFEVFPLQQILLFILTGLFHSFSRNYRADTQIWKLTVTRNCGGPEILLYLQTDNLAVFYEYGEKPRDERRVFYNCIYLRALMHAPVSWAWWCKEKQMMFAFQKSNAKFRGSDSLIMGGVVGGTVAAQGRPCLQQDSWMTSLSRGTWQRCGGID